MTQPLKQPHKGTYIRLCWNQNGLAYLCIDDLLERAMAYDYPPVSKADLVRDFVALRNMAFEQINQADRGEATP